VSDESFILHGNGIPPLYRNDSYQAYIHKTTTVGRAGIRGTVMIMFEEDHKEFHSSLTRSIHEINGYLHVGCGICNERGAG